MAVLARALNAPPPPPPVDFPYQSDTVPYDPRDPAQTQFLAWIQGSEAPEAAYGQRAYETGYTGVDLSDAPTDQYGFPQWGGRPGPAGISHAAGAFGFEPHVWADVAHKYNLNFRDPQQQRAGAWYLAQQVYRQRTGKSLVSALKSGDRQSVARALSGTWAAPAKVAGTGVGMPDSGAAPQPGGSPLLQSLLGQLTQAEQPTAEEQAALKAAQTQSDKEGALIEGEIPEADKYRQRIEGLSQEEGAPPKAPTYPTEAKEAPGNPVLALQQFLPIMAMLGGAFMRGPALASIKAATGAMNGAAAKDDAAIKLHHQQWMDSMEQLKDQWETQHQEYEDMREKYGDDLAGLQAAWQVYAAKNGLVHELTAVKMGQLDLASRFPNAKRAAMEKIIPIYQSAKEHDDQIRLEEERAAEEARHNRETEAHAGDMTPPATRVYDQTYKEAIDAGDTQDEAERKATDALRGVELATHPTAAGQVGLREERLMMSDPVIKAARTNSQYITNIESLTPDDLKTGPGQVRLLDSFTRLVTNQAIRQFMIRGAETYQGIAQRAQLILARNTGAVAPFLTPAQTAEYLKEGKEAIAEIRRAEGRQLAQHAENMEGRGVDPSQGGMTGEDLELAQANGYKPDPSKWTLSGAQDAGGTGEAQSAAPSQADPLGIR